MPKCWERGPLARITTHAELLFFSTIKQPERYTHAVPCVYRCPQRLILSRFGRFVIPDSLVAIPTRYSLTIAVVCTWERGPLAHITTHAELLFLAQQSSQNAIRTPYLWVSLPQRLIRADSGFVIPDSLVAIPTRYSLTIAVVCTLGARPLAHITTHAELLFLAQQSSQNAIRTPYLVGVAVSTAHPEPIRALRHPDSLVAIPTRYSLTIAVVCKFGAWRFKAIIH